MYCAKCNSDNIQKLSLVYESGITHTTSRSRGIGFGAGGIGVGGATTKGVHVSANAQRAAPPRRRPIFWSIAIAILGLMFAIGFSSQGMGMMLFSLLVAGISGFLAYQRIKWNGTVYPGLADHWSRSYLCNRCGAMTIPVLEQPNRVAAQAQPVVETIEHSAALPEPE